MQHLADTHVGTEEIKSDWKLEELHLEDVDDGLKTVRPTTVVDAAPLSAFGDLTTKQTVIKFKRLYGMGLAVGFAAIYMGYTINIGANVIVNAGFIEQFGTVRDPRTQALALDATHVSIWGGLNFAAQLVFQLASPLTADRFGVRTNLYILTGAMFVSIIIEIVAKNWIHWAIAKIFSGMASAYTGPAIINYLTEISMPRMRGAMLSSFAFFFSLGGLAASIALKVLDTSTHYRAAIYSQFAIFGLWVFILAFLPESPVFLCRSGKDEAAKRSLSRLIGNVPGYNVDHEFSVLKHEVKTSEALTRLYSSNDWAAMFKGNNFSRVMVSSFPLILQVLSGTPLIFGYSTFFFALSGLGDAFLGTLILNLILLAGITISIFAVDRFGRRTLLLIGAGGCAACDIAFGGIGQLGINEKAGNVVISIACIWVVFYAGSLATVGWGYLGEVSTLTLRSKTIAFATVLQSCMAIIFQFTVPIMLSPQKANWGVRIGYMFGGLTIIGMAIVYFFVPETSGRTPQEMDELYSRGIPARKFHKTETEAQKARRAPEA